MSLFAIIRAPDAINNETLAAALVRKYPDNVYRLGKGQWIVASTQSIRELSEQLGIATGKPYNGTLVVEIASYYGLHERKLWDWIKAKAEEHKQ